MAGKTPPRPQQSKRQRTNTVPVRAHQRILKEAAGGKPKPRLSLAERFRGQR